MSLSSKPPLRGGGGRTLLFVLSSCATVSRKCSGGYSAGTLGFAVGFSTPGWRRVGARASALRGGGQSTPSASPPPSTLWRGGSDVFPGDCPSVLSQSSSLRAAGVGESDNTPEVEAAEAAISSGSDSIESVSESVPTNGDTEKLKSVANLTSTEVNLGKVEERGSYENVGLWPCMDEMDRNLIKIGVPCIANFAINPLIGAVDLFWINRMANPLAVAGQAAANQVRKLLIGFGLPQQQPMINLRVFHNHFVSFTPPFSR